MEGERNVEGEPIDGLGIGEAGRGKLEGCGGTRLEEWTVDCAGRRGDRGKVGGVEVSRIRAFISVAKFDNPVSICCFTCSTAVFGSRH